MLYADPYQKQLYQSSMATDEWSIQAVPIADMEFPISADYDFGDERVYWLDTGMAQIIRANLRGDNATTILSFSNGMYNDHISFFNWCREQDR